jgi:hypothetical protein
LSDLQIGLLVLGAVAVAGVLVYNRLQERATRRRSERSFAAHYKDVLMEPSARREPTLEPLPSAPPPAPAPRREADPWLDYVVELHGGTGLRGAWAPLERRFGARVRFDDESAALQMVSRSGVVPEAELAEFRTQVERLAAAHGASVSAPPIREALEAAQALDRACADVDVQIALHVLGPGRAELDEAPFAVTRRADGLTLLLDVPRTPDLVKTYGAMVSAARRLGGRVVDDNGNALDERALAAIGVEVEGLRGRLAQLGIEPGSPLALRLFS